jgi:uncharacterized protein YbaP (TraB family)
MMLRHFVQSRAMLLMLGLVLALPALAGEGMLWAVRDARGALVGHLFGTVHLCNADCYPLPLRVRQALTASAALAVELDPSDPALPAVLWRAGSLPPGQTLAGMLPAGLEPKLRLAGARLGIAFDTLNALQPWMASSLLMVTAAARQGFGTEFGVDAWLVSRARVGGKKILALETVERQVEALGAGGAEAQAEAMAQTLRLIAEDDLARYLRDIIAAWRTGDAQEMNRLMSESADEAALAPLLDALLDQRNREMAGRLARTMSEQGPVFVAVGAAHLDGAQGLPAQLRRLGFEVHRVAEAEPAAVP